MMSVKPRKQVLSRSDDKVLLHAGLFLVGAAMSTAGLGALALWCLLPLATAVECIGRVGRNKPGRRM